MDKFSDYISDLCFYCNHLFMYMFVGAQATEVLSPPSLNFLCPRPSSPFLVILQGLNCITYPKGTTYPRHCSLVEKERRPKCTTDPKFTTAAPVVTSTKYQDTCSDAVPWGYDCRSLGTLGNSLLASSSDLLSTMKSWLYFHVNYFCYWSKPKQPPKKTARWQMCASSLRALARALAVYQR